MHDLEIWQLVAAGDHEFVIVLSGHQSSAQCLVDLFLLGMLPFRLRHHSMHHGNVIHEGLEILQASSTFGTCAGTHLPDFLHKLRDVELQHILLHLGRDNQNGLQLGILRLATGMQEPASAAKVEGGEGTVLPFEMVQMALDDGQGILSIVFSRQEFA